MKRAVRTRLLRVVGAGGEKPPATRLTIFIGVAMFTTKITTDLKEPKKALDEISLARCCVMATESLNPEEFDHFIKAHNVLIERRKLQNDLISYANDRT
ncbi:MAG: hypothetical protein KJ826_03500 [Proteobacteria bacterium]|nr:hypothetical protein [Pseudomonadota bacterium]